MFDAFSPLRVVGQQFGMRCVGAFPGACLYGASLKNAESTWRLKLLTEEVVSKEV